MAKKHTSDQSEEFHRLVEDTSDLAPNPDKDGLRILIGRGGEFQVHVVPELARCTSKLPDYTLARSILGIDFITPEEVMEARPSIAYTDDQITALAESLPSKDALKWCRANNNALIPAPPTAMSLLDVREIKSAHFYSKTGGWYTEQKFARKDKTSFGWLAIKKTPVVCSTSKNWNEQNELLSALETVPNTAEMSWFITTYFEVRGIRLFESIYVRTSSLDSSGNRVTVGYFDSDGLLVGLWHDERRDGDVGMSSGVRKF